MVSLPPIGDLRHQNYVAEKQEMGTAPANNQIDFSKYLHADFRKNRNLLNDLLRDIEGDVSKIPAKLEEKILDIGDDVTFLSFDFQISLPNLKIITFYFPNVVEVELNSLDITSEDFEVIAGWGCLKTLRFVECEIIDCKTIPNFQKHATLSMVSFQECSGVDDELILQLKPLKKLRELLLLDCMIGDRLRAESVGELSQLRSLDFSGSQVTDEFIKQVAARLRGLRMVTLNSCDEITDEAVRWIAMLLDRLENLELKNVTKLTSKALFFLRPVYSSTPDLRGHTIAHMKHLTFLDISGCPQIEAEKVKELKEYVEEIKQKITIET